MNQVPELTEEELRDYFEELGDCDAGLTGTQCSCPIAQYYAAKHGLDVAVDSYGIRFLSIREKKHKLPLWAVTFERMLDSAYYQRFVTGHQAVSILNQAVEAARKEKEAWNR